MTTADDKRLLDQVNAANNAGAVAASICDHYWAWVSPAGTRHSARLCMSCHAPDPDWLNEVHAARAYGEVGSGVCDCGLPSMHHDWGMMCATGNDFDPPLPDGDTPPCGSCGEPSIHRIILRGEPMPVCLRHLNHWRTPPDDTPPDTRSEVETLTPSQRARFMEAADAALRMRRAVLLLAEHATGHRKQVHGDRCEDCGLDYPCVTVKRAAGPVFDAVGDLPSQRPARYDWLAQHDAQVAAKAAAQALREAEFEIRDAKTIPIAARAAICAVLRGRADRIEGTR